MRLLGPPRDVLLPFLSALRPFFVLRPGGLPVDAAARSERADVLRYRVVHRDIGDQRCSANELRAADCARWGPFVPGDPVEAAFSTDGVPTWVRDMCSSK